MSGKVTVDIRKVEFYQTNRTLEMAVLTKWLVSFNHRHLCGRPTTQQADSHRTFSTRIILKAEKVNFDEVSPSNYSTLQTACVYRDINLVDKSLHSSIWYAKLNFSMNTSMICSFIGTVRNYPIPL